MDIYTVTYNYTATGGDSPENIVVEVATTEAVAFAEATREMEETWVDLDTDDIDYHTDGNRTHTWTDPEGNWIRIARTTNLG